MSQNHSVTLMIRGLRGTEAERDPAAAKIFDLYASKLLMLAHQRMSARVRQRVDAEDVVQDAYATFCRRFGKGEYTVNNRDDLLLLLAKITKNKATSAARKHTTDKGDVHREQQQARSPDAGLQPLDMSPDRTCASPEEAQIFLDELECRLKVLEPALQKIVNLKIEGLSNEEVAEKIGRSTRAVQRKLELIHAIWREHGLQLFENDDSKRAASTRKPSGK